MDIAKMLLYLLLSILTVPCLLLLVVITESLARLATSTIRCHRRRYLERRLDAGLFAGRRKYYKRGLDEEKEQVECIFCLCGIEEGEEIRELRCKHMFHRACLERWMEHRGMTCPLCRDCLVAPEAATAELADMDGDNDLGPVLMAYLSTTGWGLGF